MGDETLEFEKASLAIQSLLSQYQQYVVKDFYLLRRKVSGTYKNPKSGSSTILELRVDVDGRRPQSRLSGDFFKVFTFWGWTFTLYSSSFVVENVTDTLSTKTEAVLTGSVIYYSDPTRVNDTIEVRIPRVGFFSPAADATVKFYTSGVLTSTYVCPKISEYFRKVTLEIDRFQTATYPPAAKTCADPHPADLTCEDITTAIVYQRAGIDMTVTEDDVLNDPDSADPGSNWDEAELHDLMENRFDSFSNTLQWNLYGVVVPRFGAGATYDSGYYGVMFDWGGYQAGDTYHRQGSAVAYDAMMGRTSGTLYNNADKQNRFFLETFIHEIGHAFNLPHSWQRSANPDMASESFMNYPWKFTGGGGSTALQKETNFWSNFRWEFDDVELKWMRHANRNDVIFGGNDWIGNNLSIYTEPEREILNAPLSLEVRAREVFDYAQPVQVELKLKNISDHPQTVVANLEPEDGWVTLYIVRADGKRVRYLPPVRRLKAPKMVTLAPKESVYETVMISYSSKGPQFERPGEYHIRAYYNIENEGFIVSPSCRVRVASPKSQNTEELAYLMFSHEVAKFIYLGGSERYPTTIARLKEASQKYETTDPNVVPYIHAAMGRHLSRPFKKIVKKGDKRLIAARKANFAEAVQHLETARKLSPSGLSAFDNITYNRLSVLLSDCYQKQNKSAEAVRVLQESLQYFQKRNVVKSVLEEYQTQVAKLTKQA
jgi:tetratricopeptide (TPR) repeat protein